MRVLLLKHKDVCLLLQQNHQWQEDELSEIGRLDSNAYKDHSPRQAVALAVCSLARELKAQGIIVPTSGGTTAQVLSANRPASPLIGVSTDAAICRKLALHWGIIPYKIGGKESQDWKLFSGDVA